MGAQTFASALFLAAAVSAAPDPSLRQIIDGEGSNFVGHGYQFSGYISSRTEPRLYLKKSDLPTVENCVSMIYGQHANRRYYFRRDRKWVKLRAVVAEYSDRLIIGANKALGNVSLLSFENYCDGRFVLVIVR